MREVQCFHWLAIFLAALESKWKIAKESVPLLELLSRSQRIQFRTQ
jgi:hypothetical protein